MEGADPVPAGGFFVRILRGAEQKFTAFVRFFRRYPPIKLSYFNDVLAVELHAVNERRRLRPDEKHHRSHAREPIRKLKPGEPHDIGDHKRAESDSLPEPTKTPKMSVDALNPDIQSMRARPIPCTAVGIALSGGGIRSAAFSLGALQALDFHHVIVHTDYISTVSGGGYIGACVTAGMSDCGGVFPFGTSDVRDNDAIGHLRNYSNYLLPRAHSQLRNGLEAAAVVLRGLVANALLVFVYLLAAALLTYLAYPTWRRLPSGNFVPNLVYSVLIKLKAAVTAVYAHLAPQLPQAFGDWITQVKSSHAWSALISHGDAAVKCFSGIINAPTFVAPLVFTLMLAGITIAMLIVWAIARSAASDTANDVDSSFLRIARNLLGLTLLSAFLDVQPLAIHWLGSWLGKHHAVDLRSLFCPSALLAAAGAASTVALFAQRLGAFLETTKLATDLKVRGLRILTRLLLLAAGLVLPVILLATYWYLTACFYPESDVPQLVHPAEVFNFDLLAFVILGIIAFSYQANAYSLHQFYKDRLSKAFLFKPGIAGVSGLQPLPNFKLSKIETNCTPYHIVNAALNVQGSREANRRGRNADFFTFTRHFVGSDLTHFAVTDDNDVTMGMETIDPRLDVGSGMAVSGAAVSANMGSDTVRWLSPTLALLNIRLGYWLRNPRDLGSQEKLFQPKELLNAIRGKFYLLLEMLNLLDEERTFIYLSDGGHIENLGIYQLLKRGCRLIIAVDAEADPELSCSSLLKLERYARIDLGVRIILPWEQIRERYHETSEEIYPHTPKEAVRHRGPHCAIGRILYEDGSYGILLYFKSSMSGDEKDYLIDYKKRYPDFPHENTSDQFFTEEQFEVYRALGYHVVEGYFAHSDKISFLKDGHRAWPNITAARAEISDALGWS
jgi:hypothetical protein